MIAAALYLAAASAGAEADDWARCLSQVAWQAFAEGKVPTVAADEAVQLCSVLDTVAKSAAVQAARDEFERKGTRPTADALALVAGRVWGRMVEDRRAALMRSLSE